MDLYVKCCVVKSDVGDGAIIWPLFKNQKRSVQGPWSASKDVIPVILVFEIEFKNVFGQFFNLDFG